MKKFILYILAFFSVFALLDFGVGKGCDYLRHHTKEGSIKQFEDLCLHDEHEVLIMGSSRARHHYVPQILEDSLGLEVYNAGYDGNGVILAYGILEMITERYVPKLLIYDVEPSFDISVYSPDNKRTRYIHPLVPYYRQSEIRELIKDISITDYYKIFSGIGRNNSELFILIKQYLTQTESFPKGYELLEGEIKTEYEQKDGNIADVDSVKLKYIEKFIRLCEDKSISLLFVFSPKYGVEEMDREVFQPVVELCNKHNVPIIDYYANVYFMAHKELFKEPMHLNAKGANEYSSKIAKEIEKILSIVR